MSHLERGVSSPITISNGNCTGDALISTQIKKAGYFKDPLPKITLLVVQK